MKKLKKSKDSRWVWVVGILTKRVGEDKVHLVWSKELITKVFEHVIFGFSVR